MSCNEHIAAHAPNQPPRELTASQIYGKMPTEIGPEFRYCSPNNTTKLCIYRFLWHFPLKPISPGAHTMDFRVLLNGLFIENIKNTMETISRLIKNKVIS